MNDATMGVCACMCVTHAHMYVSLDLWIRSVLRNNVLICNLKKKKF